MPFSLIHSLNARSKTASLFFAFTFLFSFLFLSAVAQGAETPLVNPDFHSVAAGGDWNSYSTWEENSGKDCTTEEPCALPGVGDEVEINGIVLINSSKIIAGLLVNGTGLLQNWDGYSHTLTVNGDIINNGTIRNNDSGSLSLEISGNIQNNGIWNPYKTTLLDDVEILDTTTINGYLVCSDHALIVNSPNVVTIASGIGDASIFNGTGVIKLTGDIGAVISGAIPELYISGDNKNVGAEITVSKVIFEENTFISAATTINGDVEINNDVILQNWDNHTFTFTIDGNIINNGTIQNNDSGSLALAISGNIQNNGVWNPNRTILLDDVEVGNTTTINGILDCNGHALIVNVPVTITLTGDTSGTNIFNGTGVIKLTGSVRGTISGTIPELYISGDSKYIAANITIDKVIFEKDMLVYSATTINGDIEINNDVVLQNWNG